MLVINFLTFFFSFFFVCNRSVLVCIFESWRHQTRRASPTEAGETGVGAPPSGPCMTQWYTPSEEIESGARRFFKASPSTIESVEEFESLHQYFQILLIFLTEVNSRNGRATFVRISKYFLPTPLSAN